MYRGMGNVGERKRERMAQAVRRQLCGMVRSQHSPAYAGPLSSSFRHFSASGAAAREENIKEALKWRKITAIGYVVVFSFGAYTLLSEEHHEHKEQPAYSYLHIRNKEFPWGPDGLFETKHDH